MERKGGGRTRPDSAWFTAKRKQSKEGAPENEKSAGNAEKKLRRG